MNEPSVPRRPADAMYRFAAAGLGGVLLGVRTDRRTRVPLRILGLGLIAFAAQPLLARRVERAGDKRRRISFRSIIDVERPVGEVFSFFKNFENFARVIGGIRSVIDYEDGRSHWEVSTPSGGTLAWDTVVTKYVPNSVIAWASVPRSPVETTGIVRFTPLAARWTRLEITLMYRPARTSLNDAVRSFLAPRASRRLRTDLDHARFYIESLPAEPIATVSNQ